MQGAQCSLRLYCRLAVEVEVKHQVCVTGLPFLSFLYENPAGCCHGTAGGGSFRARQRQRKGAKQAALPTCTPCARLCSGRWLPLASCCF